MQLSDIQKAALTSIIYDWIATRHILERGETLEVSLEIVRTEQVSIKVQGEKDALEWENWSVVELELGVRAANTLNDANISTLGQLRKTTYKMWRDKLRSHYKPGPKTAREVEEKFFSLTGTRLDLQIPSKVS